MRPGHERADRARMAASALLPENSAKQGEARAPTTRCSAITKAGTRCPNPALPDSTFCFTHDESLAEQRAAGRKLGGLGRRNVIRAQKALPKDAQDVAHLLLWALHATATGELSPTVLTALSSGARAYVEITRGATLEMRFAEIEELLRSRSEAAA